MCDFVNFSTNLKFKFNRIKHDYEKLASPKLFSKRVWTVWTVPGKIGNQKTRFPNHNPDNISKKRKLEQKYVKKQYILEQRIEILQMELQESKEREQNLKKMNDSIMSAFNNIKNKQNPLFVTSHLIFIILLANHTKSAWNKRKMLPKGSWGYKISSFSKTLKNRKRCTTFYISIILNREIV